MAHPTDPPGGPDGALDFGNLFAQAQRLQQEMMQAQEQAKLLTVEASSGGGMVTATVSGGMELRALKIEPGCVDPKDVTMLQDLVIAAVNQALAKAQEMVQDEMRKLAGGMQLPPGLF
ncbi:MAG: YbaB/EbfC family nucleoid-associated protein [Myxococcales bacterium]|nr:YbaB/EbfC family nucleoid-associated protein [Myxococcales bacterium]